MTPSGQLTTRECAAFLISMLGVQLASELFAQWGTYFYSPTEGTGRLVYVPIALVAVIFVSGRVFDIITDPLIGAWSDRASGQRRWRFVPGGRRLPFIFWGSVLMTFTGIAFWYPPVAGTSSANLIYGTLVMSAHWGFYTLAYIPLLALAPEIARTEAERVRLGTWIGVGMILGLVIAAIAPGELISLLDPARAAGEPGTFSAAGYQRVAILFAFVSLLSFQWLVWNVRERPREVDDTPAVPIAKDLYFSLRSRPFRLYLVMFFCFYAGMLANQRALPYWAELALGGDEGTVSMLGIPFALTSLIAAFATSRVIRWLSLQGAMALAIGLMTLALPLSYPVAIAPLSPDLKFAAAALLYACTGAGLGIMYVVTTPVIGAIIDHAAAEFGQRKEAAFNAMSAVVIKAAQVLGIGIAVQTMAIFGNSAAQPLGVFLVGPVSGVMACIGLVIAIALFRVPRAPEDR
ncbi:MAG: hypothetical protein GC168_12765 [Candidatus Hydrogenedens sp.]|nr:hypothetical protein [Candidatus Hydrogenedens sp.]